MKHLILIFILITCIFYACKSQHAAITRVDFAKSSRGFREELTITKDSILIVIDNARTPDSLQRFSGKLDEKKWVQLNSSLQSVSLPEIPSFESPTMKRAHDGALHGTLIITTIEGKTYSHSFDDENPHAKLQPLMKCVQELREKFVKKF